MKINLSSFLQMRFNLFLYEKLGWYIASFYIFILGKLYFIFNRKEHKKVIEAVNFVFAHLGPDKTVDNIVKKVFQGILLHYYEKLFNAFSSVDALKTFLGLNIICEGLKKIEVALSKRSGLLLVTGHFGGVEYLPAFLSNKDIPTTIIAKFSSEDLRQRSIRKAAIYDCRIIDAGRSENIIGEIKKNLNDNRVVITQCDEIEAWRPSKRNIFSFLGKITALDRTMNILDKRCAAPIMFAVMRRENTKNYNLQLFTLDEMKKRVHNSHTMSVGELMLKTLEQFVYKHPEEWYQWKNYLSIESYNNYFGRANVSAGKNALVKPAFSRI